MDLLTVMFAAAPIDPSKFGGGIWFQIGLVALALVGTAWLARRKLVKVAAVVLLLGGIGYLIHLAVQASPG